VHPDPVLEPWRWRAFPELNGLGLQCMAEAKDRAMWFGVDDGGRRYDGVHWTAYTEKDGLYGAPVVTLLGSRDGSIYAGTAMGISRFTDGKWSRVFPPEGNLPWPISKLIEARDGSVWAGTEWGALRLSQEGPTLYTTEQMGAALRTLAPDVRLSIVPEEAAPARPRPEGIGAAVTGGAQRFRAARVPRVIYMLAPGGPGEAAGLKVGDRIVAADGQPDVSPGRLNGPAGTSVRLTIQREGRPEPFEVTVTRKKVEGTHRRFSIYDVYEDREGAIWFGLTASEGGQIVRYLPSALPGVQRSGWRLYTEKDGLDVGNWPHIAQTRDGTIWTVSDETSKGVNRLDGQAWTHFRLSDLGGGDINTSIVETRDGTLWVGGHPTLHAFRDGAWRVYRPAEAPFPSHRIRLLEASDGALWVAGLGQEAARLDYGTARWTTYEGLNFQCETPDGAQWFVSRDSSVVRYDPSLRSGQAWTRYGVEDGLMDTPTGLLATRKGVLWASGSHHNIAATAQFDPLRLAGARSELALSETKGQASTSSGQDGSRWSLQTHPRFARDIFPDAVYESPADGSLYFGAGERVREQGHAGGVLQFDGKTLRPGSGQAWTHHTPFPGRLGFVYGIGQTADGLLWSGGIDLRRFDPLRLAGARSGQASTSSGQGGQTWTLVAEPEELTSYIDAVYATPQGALWVGTRAYGAFHYDGKRWTRYDVRDGLADNRILDILQTADGSVYVGTDKGISRFDPLRLAGARSGQASTSSGQGGRTRSAGPSTSLRTSSGQAWTTYALPPDLRITTQAGSLRQSRDGALWINNVSQRVFRTTRYQPDAVPPETEITLSLDKVSQPGNTTLAWKGADPWKATPDDEVQYSYRMNGGEWSSFAHEKSKVFLALGSGAHTFEVRARDRDFNVDPTPAVLRFTVVPPVWRQPWFIGLVLAFAGITTFQASRIVIRDRKLKEGNAALSAANKELFSVNRELQQRYEELRRLEVMRETLTQMIVHDLRNPLTATQGYLQLLEVGGHVSEEKAAQGYLRVATRSTQTLIDMTTAMLDVAKLEAGEMRLNLGEVDLGQVVSEVEDGMRSLLEQKKLTFRVDLPGGLPSLRADRESLRRILVNILGNAITFSPGSGRITLTAQAEDGRVRVAMKDEGPGIPPEDRGRIFEKFGQVESRQSGRKYSTGLGLTFCKMAVEAHGGQIGVDSEVGKGSAFWFTLPSV